VKAAEVTKRLCDRKLIRYAGSVKGGGRPRIVYCAYHVPQHLFGHELPISKFFAALGWPHGRRAADVDTKILPDAELFFNGLKYLVEHDTGSMRRSQIQARWRKIQSCDAEDTVLVITRDEHRLRDLLDWSGVLGDQAHFTTLDKALSDPYGDIWVDLDGETWAIDQRIEQNDE